MADTTSNLVTLPTWEECAKAVDGGFATHLQAFIFHNEPSDTGIEGFQTEDEFRKQLALLIEYERQPLPQQGETQAPKWQTEISAILDNMGRWAVRARPGGGPEDVLASLAITLAKTKTLLDTRGAEKSDLKPDAVPRV